MGVAAAGVLAAQRWAVAPRALRSGTLAVACLAAALGASLTAYEVVDPRLCHMVWGVAAAALILAVGLAPQRRSRLVAALETRPMIFVGLASYGLYLWHEPLIYFLRAHHGTVMGGRGLLVDLPLVAAVAITVAAASYRWVEQPALRRKRRTDRAVPPRTPEPVAVRGMPLAGAGD
jgi:peptidoglycan/LPS O-acetylase OafA/YrhL